MHYFPFCFHGKSSQSSVCFHSKHTLLLGLAVFHMWGVASIPGSVALEVIRAEYLHQGSSEAPLCPLQHQGMDSHYPGLGRQCPPPPGLARLPALLLLLLLGSLGWMGKGRGLR